jgi:hypothetical protein
VCRLRQILKWGLYRSLPQQTNMLSDLLQWSSLCVLCARAHVYVFRASTARSMASSTTNSARLPTTTAAATAAATEATTATATLRGSSIAAGSCVAVPGLKNGMDYVQLGDSDLVVSKVCSTYRLYIKNFTYATTRCATFLPNYVSRTHVHVQWGP